LGVSKLERKKIVLLGRPAVGKTSIEKVFFEGVDPASLVEAALPPTMGLTTVMVPWLDMDVVIFDHPGQQMARVLDDELKYVLLLDQAFAVVYILDCTRWHDDRHDVETDINGIKSMMKRHGLKNDLVVLCHKYDLLKQESRAKTRAEVEVWAKKKAIVAYFTSIAPGSLHLLHDAFYAVLSIVSQEAKNLKGILDKHVHACKHTLCFISDAQNAVLALSATSDFSFSMLHPLPGFFASILGQFGSIKVDDKLDHVILSSRKRTRMDFRSLELFVGKNRALIIVSEDLNPIAIHKLSDAITDDLKAAFETR
jgi:signal recognition particle receptor subunit beta